MTIKNVYQVFILNKNKLKLKLFFDAMSFDSENDALEYLKNLDLDLEIFILKKSIIIKN